MCCSLSPKGRIPSGFQWFWGRPNSGQRALPWPLLSIWISLPSKPLSHSLPWGDGLLFLLWPLWSESLKSDLKLRAPSPKEFGTRGSETISFHWFPWPTQGFVSKIQLCSILPCHGNRIISVINNEWKTQKETYLKIWVWGGLFVPSNKSILDFLRVYSALHCRRFHPLSDSCTRTSLQKPLKGFTAHRDVCACVL